MQKEIVLSDKQLEFQQALLSRKYRYLLYGGGMGCFVKDTLVLCDGLKYKKIQKIQKNEKVYSYNEKTKQIELKKVLQTHRYDTEKTTTLISFYLKGGEVIKCTGNHEFYIDGMWVSAQKIVQRKLWLKKKEIIDSKLNIFEIGDVQEVIEELFPMPIMVYDLTVEDNSNYIVSKENILVHNSGKTYLGVLMIIATALQYPMTRYAIIRKNLTVLKRTTFLSFTKVARELNLSVKYNYAEMKASLSNGSDIYFVEADSSKDKDFNKLRGFELTAAMIDEANEVEEKAFNVLMLRVGRENDHGEPQFIILSTNPDNNWVRTRFYEPWRNKTLDAPYYFLPALATDNPFLSKEYLDSLKYLPEAEYQRFVMGNWDFSNDPNQLIKYEWIRNNLTDSSLIADHLGVDVARRGDDRTVFTYRKDNKMTGIDMFKGEDTITIGKEVIKAAKNKGIKAENTQVDVVGVGGGVVDYCVSQGFNVLEYNSGFRPTKDADPLLFKNRRAQSYWNLRKGLEENKIKLLDNQQLIKELTNIRYFVKEKNIQIESKDEIRKRLGFSPDYADSCAICFDDEAVGNAVVKFI